MATIGSTVQMYDNMSPVINGITSALNICINSFQSMQTASGHSIDTTSLQTARQHLAGAEASFMQVENSMRSAGSGQQDFNNRLNQGQNSAEGLATKLKNAFAVYVGFKAIGDIFKTSDELVQTKARLDLINDGFRTTDELQNAIFQSAQRSRSAYSDTANVVAKLGILARDAFSNNDEAVAFAEQMNKQFKIGGASIQEQTAGMYQLTQAMASGKLQGDEFRSIMENAPLLAQAIATYTGKSMGELRKMSSEGQITADIIKKSLFATADETEARFAKMPKTIGESWINIKNQALMAFQPVLLKINEVANNPNFNILITQMVTGFSAISIAVLSIINAVSDVAGFFQNNWTIIEPIILGVVAALIVYNASLVISNILAGEGAIAMAIKAVADWAETAALIAMTFAQEGLNAALALCPITWIIMGIIILIAIFYAAIAAMNKFGGTSLSATGMIAGAFMALGSIIYNVIALAWNVSAAYAEFLINVFTNPVEATKRLFLNLALAIIDSMIGATRGCDQFATNMANAIIGGINNVLDVWNYFVDALSQAGIAEKLGLGKAEKWSYTASITSDLDSAKSMIQDYLNTTPDNYTKVDRMDSLDIGAKFNTGYAWGANKEAWVSGLLNPQQQDAGQGYDYNDLLSKAANGADNAGKNTKDIKDKLEVTSEDLKYLRDIADRDTINRFTTAEVKVEMTNNNSVNNELDLDGIMNNLAGSVKEGLVQVREGATYEL